MGMTPGRVGLLFIVALGVAATAAAASAPNGQGQSIGVNDIPKTFTDVVPGGQDFIRRTVMIRMRDGVKLNTVIVIPKGAHDAPILLTRTPYNADERAGNGLSSSMLTSLPLGDAVFADRKSVV